MYYAKKMSRTFKIVLHLFGILLFSCAGENAFREPIQKNYVHETYVNSLTSSELRDELAFQADSDIERLHDLMYYANLIKEFKKKTGRYPFEKKAKEKDNIERIVFIATDEQTKSMEEYSNKKFTVKNIMDFIKELESGLGRKIELHFDPQFRATSFPNFYLYTIHKSIYTFRVSQFYYHSFTHFTPKRYHEVIVSNMRNREWGYQTVRSLKRNRTFQRVYNKPQQSPSFFIKQETEQVPYDLVDDKTGLLLYGLTFSEILVQYDNKTGKVSIYLYNIRPQAIPNSFEENSLEPPKDILPNIIYVTDFYQNRIYSKSFLSNFAAFPPTFEIMSDNVVYKKEEKDKKGMQIYHNEVKIQIENPSWENFTALLQSIIKSDVSINTIEGSSIITIFPGKGNYRLLETSDNIIATQQERLTKMGLIILEIPDEGANIEIFLQSIREYL